MEQIPSRKNENISCMIFAIISFAPTSIPSRAPGALRHIELVYHVRSVDGIHRSHPALNPQWQILAEHVRRVKPVGEVDLRMCVEVGCRGGERWVFVGHRPYPGRNRLSRGLVRPRALTIGFRVVERRQSHRFDRRGFGTRAGPTVGARSSRSRGRSRARMTWISGRGTQRRDV